MRTVSIPKMQEMIHHVSLRQRRPLYIWGPAGVGKTEGVEEVARSIDGVLVDLRVSQYESIDFRGIPEVSRNMTVWNMPQTIPFKGNPKFDEDGAPIVLFLDEINQGDPSVLSVLYQLLNNYRIGEFELMNNVAIVCAGNRDQDRGVTNKFPAPLSNRGTHIEVAADVRSWSKWAARHSVAPELVGFLNFMPERLHTFDERSNEKAFATPRSWMFVNADLRDPECTPDLFSVSAEGNVGDGPAAEFEAFRKVMDQLPTIPEILANPKGAKLGSKLDEVWASAAMVASAMTMDNVAPLQVYLDRMKPEMVVMAWTLAIGRDEDLCDTDTFVTHYAPKYRGMFED